MVKKKLPPLPGSDEDTLKSNRKDSFYDKRPRDIWGGFIEHTEIEESPECEHYFVETVDGARCEKCDMGLIGKDLTTENGHVFFGDQKLF